MQAKASLVCNQGDVMRRLICCAALIVVFAASAGAGELDPKTIVVTGSAELAAKPDRASINIGVDTSDKVTVKALEANNVLMHRVVDAIRGVGIPEAAMQTANFSITALHPPGKSDYDYDYSKTIGYAVSNTLIVTISDIDKVGGVIDAAVRAGANTSNSVVFEAKNQNELTDKVLADAVRNARHNAEVMAAAEGAKVGKVVSLANSTSCSPHFPASLRTGLAYAAAPPPVMPGEVPISADVVVVYTLE
jgi:uncharacterized protein